MCYVASDRRNALHGRDVTSTTTHHSCDRVAITSKVRKSTADLAQDILMMYGTLPFHISIFPLALCMAAAAAAAADPSEKECVDAAPLPRIGNAGRGLGEGTVLPHESRVGLDECDGSYILTHITTREHVHLPGLQWEAIFDDQGFGALLNCETDESLLMEDLFTQKLVSCPTDPLVGTCIFEVSPCCSPPYDFV